MDVSLAGKRVFVTAGAAGIGRSVVLAMRDAGATVFTCDIDEEAVDTLPDDIAAEVCDVSDSSALDVVFDAFLPDGLDIMVNNAGVSGPTKPIEEVTDEEWRHTMAVNVDSYFFCARRVVPVFKAQGGGSIINVISNAGLFGYPTRSPYSSSKWAVTGLTKTLAMELGPDKIRVNGVAPGNVTGDRGERVIQAHAADAGIDPEEVRRLYSIGTSLQCYVDPEEIADLVVFLASDRARHISGQVIGIDGNTETMYPRT